MTALQLVQLSTPKIFGNHSSPCGTRDGRGLQTFYGVRRRALEPKLIGAQRRECVKSTALAFATVEAPQRLQGQPVGLSVLCGIPDYRSPRPYGPSVPSPLRKDGASVSPGDTAVSSRKFWDYQSPKAASPPQYGAPKLYDSPAAYGPSSGGSGGAGGSGSNGGGGGGGGGGQGGEAGGDGRGKKKLKMSQIVTLAYAILVIGGGTMGFVKSGSAKSLLAGLFSGLLLLYVFSRLPVDPSGASSIGLGVSAALMVVMGMRFVKSKKFMPAGLVSVVSFIMSGGYIHGVMRAHH